MLIPYKSKLYIARKNCVVILKLHGNRLDLVPVFDFDLHLYRISKSSFAKSGHAVSLRCAEQTSPTLLWKLRKDKVDGCSVTQILHSMLRLRVQGGHPLHPKSRPLTPERTAYQDASP